MSTETPTLSYKAVHARLKRQRGRAKDHLCSCGKQAEHWAYQHTDEPVTDLKGCAYSEDLSTYAPMCRSCHYALDVKMSERRVNRERASK